MYKTLLFLIFLVFFLISCNRGSQSPNEHGEITKHSLSNGPKLFAKKCASCHGRGAKGTDQGPPLIHKIYESSHHGDVSFFRAAEKGVRAHHWQFGDMPPIKDISKSDMTVIINYVRYEQGKAGIH